MSKMFLATGILGLVAWPIWMVIDFSDNNIGWFIADTIFAAMSAYIAESNWRRVKRGE